MQWLLAYTAVRIVRDCIQSYKYAKVFKDTGNGNAARLCWRREARFHAEEEHEGAGFGSFRVFFFGAWEPGVLEESRTHMAERRQA